MRVQFDGRSGYSRGRASRPDRPSRSSPSFCPTQSNSRLAADEVSVAVEKGLDMVRLTVVLRRLLHLLLYLLYLGAQHLGAAFTFSRGPPAAVLRHGLTQAMRGRRAAPVLASVLSSRSSTDHGGEVGFADADGVGTIFTSSYPGAGSCRQPRPRSRYQPACRAYCRAISIPRWCCASSCGKPDLPLILPIR